MQLIFVIFLLKFIKHGLRSLAKTRYLGHGLAPTFTSRALVRRLINLCRIYGRERIPKVGKRERPVRTCPFASVYERAALFVMNG